MNGFDDRLSIRHALGVISKIKSKIGTLQFIYWYLRGTKPITAGDHTIFISVNNHLGDFREIRFFEQNEIQEMNNILNEIRSDDVFLDIGANIGIHSIFAGELADKVYSIEPHPVNSSYLMVNNLLNNAELNIYQCGFSDNSQYIELSSPRGGLLADGSSALSEFEKPSKEGPSDEPNKVNVRIESGDDFLRSEGIPAPNIIKIDVEGAESKVIDGLKSTLANEDCRIVYCEVHVEYVNYNSITSKLKKLGYNIEIIDERSYCKTIKAVRTSSV